MTGMSGTALQEHLTLRIQSCDVALAVWSSIAAGSAHRMCGQSRRG